MEIKKAIHKLDFMLSAYQKLIDEKVDEGRFVGTDVTGTWKADTPLNDAYKEHIEALDLAISALKKQEQDRWIPVTERMPEEDEDVLVTVHFLGLKQTHPNGWNDHIKPSFYVDIARHYVGEWCSVSDEYKVARSRHIVTAWRPLPEPYTGEET